MITVKWSYHRREWDKNDNEMITVKLSPREWNENDNENFESFKKYR